MEGVSSTPANGSEGGAVTDGSGFSRNACHQTTAPTPARRRTMETNDQTTFAPDGALATSGSCGQLFV